MFPRRFPDLTPTNTRKVPKTIGVQAACVRVCVVYACMSCVHTYRAVRGVNRSYATNAGKLEHAVACTLRRYIYICTQRTNVQNCPPRHRDRADVVGSAGWIYMYSISL